MQAEFWQARWAQQQIGFHLDRVNPYLLSHWPGLQVPQGSRVLVPLCGKSLDLAWLAGQGFAVMGVELARTAVDAFFEEHRLTPSVRRQGAFDIFQAGSIEIWCGDFFDLGAEDLADCRAYYDRAALIALPADMRRRYAAILTQCLPHGTQGLLVTLDYDQQQIDGPPFAVPDAEVYALLREWQPERLAQADVLAENRKFHQRGVPWLRESVFRLLKR
ncbi:thiopurine S-methyltransferase [Stutzerimonas azotifigens]|uniref:Thiopurine S-methyltransferase n=1 Tax=Stutzerimonas azotifigens TaxID=291995 RepID=A0ABR5Z3H3_9GAMM|nr:thiopurine S-methyltransferase [Stutzerimonas azotifigens]MBA1274696.1 thiopurine S-methyltransferase [Stutzerimonas azotifigens]